MWGVWALGVSFCVAIYSSGTGQLTPRGSVVSAVTPPY